MGYAKYYGIAAGVAGALTVAALSSSSAAPISAGAVSLKSAVTSDVVDVRWRGRRWGYYGGGFATGLAVGALAARPYYYEPYYYAPPPACLLYTSDAADE